MRVGSFQIDLVELANALAILFASWKAYTAHRKHVDKKRQSETSAEMKSTITVTEQSKGGPDA